MYLEVADVRATIGPRVLFTDLNMEAQGGQIIAIMGPSGSGKSTLLSMIAGQTKQDAGTIRIVDPPPRRAFRTEWLIQSSPLLNRRSATDNAVLAGIIRFGDNPEIRSQAAATLSTLGLAHVRDQPIYRLSGGERQRVAVARAIVARPDLILADEPTASLDPLSRDAVLSALEILRRQGSIVLIATHDQVVADSCDDVLRIEAFGRPPHVA